MAISKQQLQAFMKKEAPAPYRKAKAAPAEEPEPAAAEAEPEAEEPGVDADEIGAQVQAGNGSPKLMKLAQGVTEETNPPQWVSDEATWEKAKAAVEPKWDEYDEPYAVVTHVYSKMGGKIRGAK